jgi:CRP/FNR family transcriptional regulator, cyclic AMP receptor protein
MSIRQLAPEWFGPQIGKGRASSLENAHRLLRECALFRGLVADQVDVLITRARIRHFVAGQTIFSIGSPGDSMMAVLAGNVRISVPSMEGRELLLAILHPGEFFGEIAVLDGKARTADAQAITDCGLAIFDRCDVLDLLQRHPNALVSVVEVLCHRLRETDEHIAEVALLHLRARLAKTLLRMSKQKSPSGQSSLHLSQQEIANMVGAARESVNKYLREWQRSGILRIDGSVISILDRVALRDIAEQE